MKFHCEQNNIVAIREKQDIKFIQIKLKTVTFRDSPVRFSSISKIVGGEARRGYLIFGIEFVAATQTNWSMRKLSR